MMGLLAAGLIAMFLTYRMLKAWLISAALDRADRRYDALYMPPSAHEEGTSHHLLPSQRAFVESFVHEMLTRDVSVLTGKVYAIQGVWGAGKSTVVTAIRQALQWRLDQLDEGIKEQDLPAWARGPKVIPLYMNAWREETPDDLHFRVVEHIALDPRVLKLCAPVLSLRFLISLAKGRPLKPSGGWLTAVIKGRGKAQAMGHEAALEAEAKWERPTPLDFQEDLDRMMAAIKDRDLHLALVVDEIERGTRQSAQAMAVLLKRSLDYARLHLVVPYVQEVMDALVFNPINQSSEELRTATEAVLSTHQKLRADAIEQTALAMTDMTAWPADQRIALPSDDRDPHRVFRAALLRGFCRLPRMEQYPLQTLMREKYFGFYRELPRQTMEDLAFFAIRQDWLASPAGRRTLEGLLQSAFTQEADEDRSLAVAVFLEPDGPARPAAQERIRRALLPMEGLKAFSFAAGEFSWRSFGGELQRLLDNWASRPDQTNRSVRGLQATAAGGSAHEDMLDFLAQVIAMAVLVAAGLMRQRQRRVA